MSQKIKFALIFFLPLSFGALLGFSHLDNRYNSDEVMTLTVFLTDSIWNPFFDYHDTNNHILFSFLLSIWRSAWGGIEASLELLRILPYSFFLISIIFLIATSANLFGWSVGFFSGLLFASSHLVLNYSAQLRGYSLSWVPLIVSYWAILSYFQSSKQKYLLVYFLFSAVAVGILPTNALVCFSVFLYFIFFSFLGKLNNVKPTIGLRKIFLFLILGPSFGVVFYLFSLNDLIDHFLGRSTVMTEVFHHLNKRDIIRSWFHILLFESLYLLPLYFLGCPKLFQKSNAVSRMKLSFIVSIFVSVPLFSLFFSATPPLRIFTVFLPFCCLSFSFLLHSFVESLKVNRKRVASVMISCLVIICSYLREKQPKNWIYGYQETQLKRHWTGPLIRESVGLDRRTIDVLSRLNEQRPLHALLNTDAGFLYTLESMVARKAVKPIPASHIGYIRDLYINLENAHLVLVSKDEQSARDIVEQFQLPVLPNWRPQLIDDSGSFDIYRCELKEN